MISTFLEEIKTQYNKIQINVPQKCIVIIGSEEMAHVCEMIMSVSEHLSLDVSLHLSIYTYMRGWRDDIKSSISYVLQ